MAPGRRQLLGWGALGAAATLAGCGGDNGGGHRSKALRFEGWDFESALVQQNVDRFVRLHPDIPVNYRAITSAQYIQKIVAEYTAGNPPDALYVYDDSLASWVASGYLQPIEGMPGVEGIYDRIYPSNAETMTYHGKRYGLPYYTDTQCLAYNEKILAKAGFSHPPKTLEELEHQALAIKKQGILEYPIGVCAQLSDTWWAWWWSFIYASGGKLFDDDMRPVMASSDTVLRDVYAWLQHAINVSKVLDPASLQLLPIPADNAFMSGQYAFMPAARYGLRKYNDPKSSQIAGHAQLAMVPSLHGDTTGTVSTTRMYCLAAGTQHKADAYKLISYLGAFDEHGNPYTAKFWFEKQGLGFAFPELAKNPKIRAELSTFADPQTYQKLAQVAKPRSAISALWYSEFEAAAQRLTQQAMTRQLSPDRAVQDMAATVGELKQRYA